MSEQPIQTGEFAQAIASGPDTLPDAGPPWRTLKQLFHERTYGHGLPPFSTGYATLDVPLHGGFRPESMYVIAGRTGFAKSTLAANIARLCALNGVSVLAFKLEESAVEFAWRIHAAAAQVNFRVLLDGVQKTSPEYERLTSAWGVIKDIPLRVSDARGITDIERIAGEHKTAGGRLIILDQISCVEFPGNMSAYERMSGISSHLRLLARNLRIPVVAVAQINRAASKGKESLSCNDLRDSGQLENDASAVLLIDRIRRPDVYRTPNDPYALEVIIGKNRYGQCTRDGEPLELDWFRHSCRIEDPPGKRQRVLK